MADLKQIVEIIAKLSVQNKEAFSNLAGQIEEIAKAEQIQSKSSADAAESAADLAQGLQAVKGVAGGATIALTAAAATLGAFISLAEKAAEKNAELEETLQNGERATGAFRENLVGLGTALEEANTGSLKDAEFFFIKLNKAIQDNDGSLTKLGVTSSNVNVAFEQIVKTVKETQGGAAALTKELNDVFGRGAVEALAPAIDSFDEVKQRVKDTGLLLEGTAAEAAGKLDSALDKLTTQLKGASVVAGSEFVPEFTKIIELISTIITNLSKNEEFTSGLKELAKFGVAVIDTTLVPLIVIIKEVVETLSLVGKGLGALKNFLNPAAEGTKELAEGSKEAAGGVKDLGDKAAEAAPKLGNLAGEIKKVKEEQSLLVNKAAADTKAQIQIFEDFSRQRKISAEKAAIEIGKIEEDLAQKRVDAAFQAFAVAKEKIEERERLDKEALDRVATSEKAARAQGITDLSIEVAERQRIARERAEFDKSIQKEIFETETELRNAATAQEAKRNETVKNTQAGRLEDLKRAVEGIEAEESDLTNELQRQLNERKINQEDFEQGKRELSASSTAKIITEESKALKDLTEKRQENTAEAIALKKRLVDDTTKFAAQERDIQIKALDEVISHRRAQAIRAKDEEKGFLDELVAKFLEAGVAEEDIIRRVAQLRLETTRANLAERRAQLDQLREQGASEDKIAEKQAEINDLVREEKQLRDAIAGRTNETAKNIKSQVDGIKEGIAAAGGAVDQVTQKTQSLSDVFDKLAITVKETFKFDINNLQAARQFYSDLLADATDLFKIGAFPGKLEAIQSFLDAAEELRKKIAAAESQIQREAEAKEFAERTAAAESLYDRLFEIAENEKEKEAELDEDLRKAKKKAKEDEAKERESFEADEKESLEDQKNDLQEIEDDAAEKLADLDKREKADAKKREEDFQASIAAAKRKARDEELEAEINFITDKDEINDELKRLNEEAAGVTDPAKQKEIQDKIKEQRQKLLDLTAKEAARAARQKEKDAAIEEARASSSSKEEFDAKGEAIEADFDLREKEAAAIEKLGKDASEAEKQQIRDLFQKRRDIINEGLTAELNRIKQDAIDRENERTAERNKILDDLNTKRQDRIDAGIKERADRQKEFDDRLEDIKTALAKERKEIQKARDALTTDTAEALAKTSSEFGIGTDAAQKFFDEIIKGGKDSKTLVSELIAELQKARDALKPIGGVGSSTPPASGPGGSPSQQQPVGGVGGTPSAGGGPFGGGSGGGGIFRTTTPGNVPSSSPIITPSAKPTTPITPGLDQSRAKLISELLSLYSDFRRDRQSGSAIQARLQNMVRNGKLSPTQALRIFEAFQAAKRAGQGASSLQGTIAAILANDTPLFGADTGGAGKPGAGDLNAGIAGAVLGLGGLGDTITRATTIGRPAPAGGLAPVPKPGGPSGIPAPPGAAPAGQPQGGTFTYAPQFNVIIQQLVARFGDRVNPETVGDGFARLIRTDQKVRQAILELIAFQNKRVTDFDNLISFGASPLIR